MCFNCFACDVAVHATQQSQGSVSIINKAYYTKKFDVSIVNLSESSIDLSSLSLVANSPDGKVFKLGTIDETLVSGNLEPMKIAKGIAVFTSEDDSVYFASMVKSNFDCKL